MRVFHYVRVSKDDKGGEREQDPQWQLELLRAESKRCKDTVVGEYIDLESGNSMMRENFVRMLSDAAAGKGDMVRVWKIDRFIRAEPIEGLIILYQLLQMKVAVKSLTETAVDTTKDNPLQHGLMWVVICVFLYLGNEEREKTKERTKAGIAYKRVRCVCEHHKDQHPNGPCAACACLMFDPQWKGGRPKGRKDTQVRLERRWDNKPKIGAMELMTSISDVNKQKSE